MMKKIIKKINLYKEQKYLSKLRAQNSNKDFSIVCNNCVGGVIYHNLGVRFNSPTINLFIRSDEYLEFVKNFEYYSECDIVEVYEEGISYPIGKLVPKDDEHKEIMVYFQHYENFEIARKKWKERYLRVNWNNLYYIWEFYDTIYDDKDIYEFDKLNELKKKIILTHKEYKDIKNAFQISCYRNDEPRAKILEYKGISGKRFLEEFDYTGFLN